MKIRKAVPEDHIEAVELIYQANLGQASLFTGEDEKEKIIEKLTVFFISRGSFLSYEQCVVIEDRGSVAGCMIAFGHEVSEELSLPVIDNLMKRYKPGSKGYRKYIQPQLEVSESFPGEYYVDSIAVEKEYRRQGVGRGLMAYAEKAAVSSSYKKISLLCSHSNDKAYKLYESLGYSHDIDIKIKDLTYRHMVKVL